MGTSADRSFDNGVPYSGLTRPRMGHSRNISTPNLHFSGFRSGKRQTWNELNRTSSSAALTAASLAAKVCSAKSGETRQSVQHDRRRENSSYRYGQTVRRAYITASKQHEYQNESVGSSEMLHTLRDLPPDKENLCRPTIVCESAVEADSTDSSDSNDEIPVDDENLGSQMEMLAISSDELAHDSQSRSELSIIEPESGRRGSSTNLRSRRKPPPVDSTATINDIGRADNLNEAQRRPLLTLRGTEKLPSPSPYEYGKHNISSQQLLTGSDEDSDEESDVGSKMDVPNYTIVSGMILEDPVYKRHHHHHHYYHTQGLSRMLGFQKGDSQENLSYDSGRSSPERRESSVISIDSGQPSSDGNKESPLVFRTTLRDSKKPSKRHRKNHIKEFDERKPWKHHKASSYVTEEEKESYDIVWKANKNAYLKEYEKLRETRQTGEDRCIPDFSKYLPKDRIVGIVVREIWRRSRLSDEMLAQIWNLIMAHRSKVLTARFEPGIAESDASDASIFDDGTLTETEFLVGMWMVDQCLYGRKLPKEIEPSVWDSVESTGAFDARRLKHHMRKKMLSKVVGKI